MEVEVRVSHIINIIKFNKKNSMFQQNALT